MRIVCFTHHYLPYFNSGGETYLHRLLKHLQSFGHEVTVIADYENDYIHDGIQVRSQGCIRELWTANNDIIQNCDVVFSQLIGSAYGSNKASQFRKPLVWFAHNRSKAYPAQHNQDYHVVYNSHYVKEALQFDHIKSTILQPLIDYRNFKPSKQSKRKYVTLINCNDNKGGDRLILLAKRLPQYQFIGIIGAYGDQIIDESLSNLKYLPNSNDISEVLSETKLLLMPSMDETYGQTAGEAMAMGIPVLFHPTGGLIENLSYAGVSIDRNDLTLYAETIDKMFKDKLFYESHCKTSLDRAIELDPLPRVAKFNEWLLKVK